MPITDVRIPSVKADGTTPVDRIVKIGPAAEAAVHSGAAKFVCAGDFTDPATLVGGRRRRGSRRLNRTKKPKMNRKRRGSRRR